MSNIVEYRVYYEDTDAGGVVYYANYLKYAERARTDYLRELGISQAYLKQDKGIIFVVRSANMELFRPAKLDNLVQVKTIIDEIGAASIKMIQKLFVNETQIAEIKVKIACVSTDFRPIKLDDSIKNKLLSV